MALCTATKRDGSACGGNAVGDTGICRWHTQTPEMRATHRAESKKGGNAKAAAAVVSTDALASDPMVIALDLATTDGLKGVLGFAIGALTKLPFDVKVANAIGFLATSQRTIIEQSDITARLAALEAAAATKDGEA